MLRPTRSCILMQVKCRLLALGVAPVPLAMAMALTVAVAAAGVLASLALGLGLVRQDRGAEGQGRDSAGTDEDVADGFHLDLLVVGWNG